MNHQHQEKPAELDASSSPTNEVIIEQEHASHVTGADLESFDHASNVEKQELGKESEADERQPSAIKGLGWLDRLLALWILLAMIIGILIGNFVHGVDTALHRGEFVGVSVPIGE